MRGVYLVMVVAVVLCLGAGVVSAQVGGGSYVNAKVYLSENDFNDTVDFGFIPDGNATLGNFVWMDINKNGTQEDGELGIEGVTVNLWNLDLGIKFDTTTTDKYGIYWFNNLPAGNYTVSIDMTQNKKLDDFKSTKPNQGDDDTKDSDGIESSDQMLIG